ncbi:MAG: DUF58 domain-containing protein [Alphaproteobacteria bacterium]|nr:DUF58 domain-containing protein [Alphaproteobacteria bacterium]
MVQLTDAAESLAATLPSLMVRAERLASSITLGMHGRRKAGIGQSFWQFHHYRPGDAVNAIDWRQSAKSQHLYVREREWEAAQSVWLWRDGSPSMRFGSGGETKLNRATLLTLALAVLLVRGGERIALYGEREAPASSRATYRRIGFALTERPPSDAQVPPEAVLPRNAQFVWFGDFLAPIEATEQAIRRLTRSNAGGRLVHIIDPAEEDFPYLGRTRFESVHGTENRILGRAESVAGEYRARFKAHGEAVALLARKLGWNYTAHRTDRSPQAALVALYADLSGGHRMAG